MAGRFLIKDIALQAGVGTATVDRVLHGRSGVHAHTVRRVRRAIQELEAQESTLALKGRKFVVDLIVEAPEHFRVATEKALVAELPSLLPAVFRVRRWMEQNTSDERLKQLTARIRKRGSHGILLMGSESPGTLRVIDELATSGIPVVTLVTDIPRSRRIAYVGMDNFRGGQTAALLVGSWLRARPAKVLVTVRNARMRGEEEREAGFRSFLSRRYPGLECVELVQGRAVAADFMIQVEKVLSDHRDIRAVYSIGGSNKVIVQVLEQLRRRMDVFIAHDLDAANTELLRSEKISTVLHHDLKRDLREALRAIMRFHRALPSANQPGPNPIVIITPTNLD